MMGPPTVVDALTEVLGELPVFVRLAPLEFPPTAVGRRIAGR